MGSLNWALELAMETDLAKKEEPRQSVGPDD